MAKINKIKKWVDGVLTTIYPLTIPQAVIDPTSGKSARAELDEKANHGYETEPKTLKQVDDSVVQLAGDVSVKIKNEVVNGDFRNGNIGYIANLGTLTGEGKFIATTKDGRIERASGYRVSFLSGEVVYTAARFKADSPLAWFNSSTGGATGGFHSGSGMFETVSRVYTATSDFINTPFISRVGDGRSSGWTEIEVAYFVLINLTTVFGAGNEPTKEEFELLLSIMGSQYFEGEITIPAQKVMQWQLKLIRKNKNAIIALGGTII